MNGILNTMHASVPFEHERRGGYHNLQAAVPFASDETLLPFVTPSVEASLVISREYLVHVDNFGKVINRYLLTDYLTLVPGKLRTYAYNDMSKDAADNVGVNFPCGLYYFQVYFQTPGAIATDPEPEQYSYKTEIFEIDKKTVDSTLPPRLGDYSPLDYNNDYFVTI